MPGEQTTCRAAVCTERGKDFKLELRYDYPVPSPKEDEVLVRLNYTGICMSDVHNMIGDLGLPGTSDCPGHEGAGVIVKLGERVKGWKVGDRVGLGPCKYACRSCDYCLRGYEANCPTAVQNAWADNGTYCQYLTQPASYLTRIPDGLADEIAAPLCCSGVTTYRAVNQSGAKIGDWLLVPGAGGGVGSSACQYAAAAGIRVIGIDTTEGKRKLCLEKLGCEHFIDFKECKDVPAEVMRITGTGAHASIITGGTPAAYANWWDSLRVGGVMVTIGLPPKGTTVAGADPIVMVIKSLRVQGSRVGNYKETGEALRVAAAGKVKPIISVFPFEKFLETLDNVRYGKLPGRAVIKFDD